MLVHCYSSLFSLFISIHRYLDAGKEYDPERHHLTLFECKCAILSLTNRELTKGIIKQKLRHFNRVREMEDLSLGILDDEVGVSLETFLLIVRDVASTELNINQLDKTTFAEGDKHNRGSIKSEDFMAILSRRAPILSEKRGNDVFKALDPLEIGIATFPNYKNACVQEYNMNVNTTGQSSFSCR